MKLTRLRVQNYKAFSDASFEPDPTGLTTIIGANGSGKTSLWEVLSLLARLANHWQYQWLELQFAGRGRSFVGCLPWHDASLELLVTLEIEHEKRNLKYSVGWRAHPNTGLPQLSTEHLTWDDQEIIRLERATGRYEIQPRSRVTWPFKLAGGYPIVLSTVASSC